MDGDDDDQWRRQEGRNRQRQLHSITEMKKALNESDAAVRAGLEQALNPLVAAREARISKLEQLGRDEPRGAC